MQLEDEGLLISVAPFRDHHALVAVLTPRYGVLRGIAKGALSSRRRSEFQPGTRMQVRWQARLEEHLGNLTCEAIQSPPPAAYLERDRCYALQSLTQLLSLVLIERDPHPALYEAAEDVLSSMALADARWYGAWVRFEQVLLEECGFGLELSHCAATGSVEELIYLSPKSGQAVSRAAGAPYHDKLFALPASWRGEVGTCAREFAAGLAITGHFIEHRVLQAIDRELPTARRHLHRVITALVPAPILESAG